MKYLRKQIGPILFLLTILGVNAILWISRMRSAYLVSNTILTAVMGSSLLMGFFIVFVLSTRNRLIVKIFGGLENVYIWHRSIAVVTTVSIFVHGYFATARGITNIPDVFLLGQAMEAGELARNIFIGLILFALIAKFMKYEHFRYIHRLLLVPYIYALYHGFFTSIVDLFKFDLLSIWMILTSIIGLSSSIYMIVIYQRTSFKNRGTVIDKKLLNESIFELKVKMDKDYLFKPGQFCFIKIYEKNFPKEPHPFSISGFDGENIYFTIKSLGDFTDLLNKKLETPSKIRITRPFGDMTFETKYGHLIWLAGGIGITPFLGYIRTKNQIDKKINMIYSVRNTNEAVHLENLYEISKKNTDFSFKLFDASKDGFITAHDLGIDNNSILYMCGPRPMVLAIKKQMKKSYPKTPVVYEAFSFTGTLAEDILALIKKVIKKFKN